MRDTEAFCVRAEFGRHTSDFVKGGYVGVGWLREHDLSDIAPDDREQLERFYLRDYPERSKMNRAQNVSQIARFLFELTPGCIVLTPSENTEEIYWGKVIGNYSYQYPPPDKCPYPHRKKVQWEDNPVLRSSFSVPLQNTLQSSLTIFSIKHKRDLFKALGLEDEEPPSQPVDYAGQVLQRILLLGADDFEIFLTHLLAAIGFEASHTGQTADQGVDVKGVLDIYGIARVNLVVQAKRYSLGTRIPSKQIRDFRGAVPDDSQACFITTANFARDAREEARRPGFKRIGLIAGEQLVDILVEEYDKLPEEIKEKLSLEKVLIPQ